jgi:hypothetical protein
MLQHTTPSKELLYLIEQCSLSPSSNEHQQQQQYKEQKNEGGVVSTYLASLPGFELITTMKLQNKAIKV